MIKYFKYRKAFKFDLLKFFNKMYTNVYIKLE